MPKTEERKNNPEPNAPPTEKKRKESKGDSTGVRLDESLRNDVERICTEEGIPFARFVQDAVKEHVTNPVRQRNLVLHSMTVARQEIEKAKQAEILPVEAVEEFLEQVKEDIAGVKSPPGRTRKPFRFFPPLIPRTLLGGDDE